MNTLQQYLPFTVLKRSDRSEQSIKNYLCCNSTYRLRYWNSVREYNKSVGEIVLQQYLPFTVLKLCAVTIFCLQPTPQLQQYLPFTVLKRQDIYF